MKKYLVFISFILVFSMTIMTGCGSGQETADQSTDQTAEQSTQTAAAETGTSDATNPDGSAVAEGSSAQDTTLAGGASSDGAAGTEPAGNASVIVQSNNAITDAEKQQILNELNSEIDSLINSLNGLEDATDADLTFE
jgi:ABC-type Fe3+-hydroxamate transport system substrate-binding protein